MKRQSARLSANDKPDIWIGVNFWSRVGGPRMWRDYDSTVVSEELDQLHELRMDVTRSFFFWPDFMPTHHRSTLRQMCLLFLLTTKGLAT